MHGTVKLFQSRVNRMLGVALLRVAVSHLDNRHFLRHALQIGHDRVLREIFFHFPKIGAKFLADVSKPLPAQHRISAGDSVSFL